MPLAIQQKQIIVTCNYEARKRGLSKLQLITEAKKACPDLVIILGEDLTRFRNASKALYNFLRQSIWSNRLDRLGFDEVFLDTTDMINYNVELLNQNDLRHSFFHLDKTDPTVGFPFDATVIAGPAYPASDHQALPNVNADEEGSLLLKRLLLASHLAMHLRLKMEEQTGYTSSVGVATSKLLSKLIGVVNKPKGQTTLLPPYSSNVTEFVDSHDIGRIPGIGFKFAQKIRAYFLGRDPKFDKGLIYGGTMETVTVKNVRTMPGMGSEILEQILGGAGAPKDIGVSIWGLLHGVDDKEVGVARGVPRQISLEDSYIRLDTLPQVHKELLMLSTSLIKRMHIDLVEEEEEDDDKETSHDTRSLSVYENEPEVAAAPEPPRRRWLAHPKTMRLSTRPRPPLNPDGTRPRSFNRISRSFPCPNFLFSLTTHPSALTERLVEEVLLPQFRRLHPEKSGWDLSLVNLAVTNMVEAAAETKDGKGRDIARMFRNQEKVLSEWRVTDTTDDIVVDDEDSTIAALPPFNPQSHRHNSGAQPHSTLLSIPRPFHAMQAQPIYQAQFEDDNGLWMHEDESLLGSSSEPCGRCGALVPDFAVEAHQAFHSTE